MACGWRLGSCRLHDQQRSLKDIGHIHEFNQSSPSRVPISRIRRPLRPVASTSSQPDHNPFAERSDGIYARMPSNPSKELINPDLAPTTSGQRFFSTLDLTALWTSLVICVPSYCLASGLIELGMSVWQGVFTVFIGNAIILIPMVLNGMPGCKYGLAFPVLARASFGIKGALIPALVRGLVACGWFGLQTWLGGAALLQLITVLFPAAGLASAPVISWLGITAPQLGCFAAFWSIQLVILLRGMEGIKVLENISAPILLAMSAALMMWAVQTAGGIAPIMAAPSQFAPGMPKEGQFWKVFMPAVTANVAFWATLSLNIPDFTRYATSQRAQVVGQALGLPFSMAFFAFMAMAVTAATRTIFGTLITDPIALVGQLQGVVPLSLAMGGLVLATLGTNIAANIVAPVNALVAADPSRFNFNKAAILTSVIGAIIQPWRLIANTDAFLFKWLIGSSILLAPVVGIILVDYYLLRGQRLNIDALYSNRPTSRYYYSNGYNPAAMWAMTLGVLPTLPGFASQVTGWVVPAVWHALYNSAWFVGCGAAAVSYYVLMTKQANAQNSTQLSPASA